MPRRSCLHAADSPHSPCTLSTLSALSMTLTVLFSSISHVSVSRLSRHPGSRASSSSLSNVDHVGAVHTHTPTFLAHLSKLSPKPRLAALSMSANTTRHSPRARFDSWQAERLPPTLASAAAKQSGSPRFIPALQGHRISSHKSALRSSPLCIDHGRSAFSRRRPSCQHWRSSAPLGRS